MQSLLIVHELRYCCIMDERIRGEETRLISGAGMFTANFSLSLYFYFFWVAFGCVFLCVVPSHVQVIDIFGVSSPVH